MKAAVALTCAVSAVAAACGGAKGTGTPPVPDEATPVEEARPGPGVVYGYLTAPPDAEDALCSRENEEGTCLVVQRFDAAAYPGLEKGCCAIGYFSTTKVPIRGVVRDGALVADPSESLRGCVTAMDVQPRRSDERAVARALLDHPDVRSVRVKKHWIIGGAIRSLVAAPASADAVRTASRAGEIAFVGCDRS